MRELDCAASLVGGTGSNRRGKVVGDEDCLRRVEARAFELFERRGVVRSHLPVSEQFGARQGAVELKQSELAIGGEHSRQLVEASRFSEAWLGSNVEGFFNAKSFLGRIELCVQ